MEPVPAFRPSGLLTLTTDFGARDAFVGAMKGRMLADFPGARIVDVSHEVPPQDVLAGAFVMEQACLHFPPGTVHLGVVDPGVGSSRGALIANRLGEHLFVGPDNGLFTLAAGFGDPGVVFEAWRLDRLPPDWTIAPTFHGRDLFGRVAARLAAGAPIAEFSTGRLPDPVRLEVRAWGPREGGFDGEVLLADRFGNLVTTIAVRGACEPSGEWVVEIGERSIPVVRTFADVAPGALLAYTGSADRIEIAVRDGSAATELGAGRGTRVRLRRA